MDRKEKLIYQLQYNARMRGNWSPENEMDYIDKLMNPEFLAKTFEGYEFKPTSEELLQNYIISFRKRFVNRTFRGWETEDYEKIREYAQDAFDRLQGE